MNLQPCAVMISGAIRGAVMMCGVMMLAVGCASSGSRATDEEVASAAATHNESAEDEDKLICKKIRSAASHIPRRVCRTQAEIDRARETAQSGMRDRWGDNPGVDGQ